MQGFGYVRVDDCEGAFAAVRDADARFIAGGTELVNLMKERIDAPGTVVDINALPLAEIEVGAVGLRLGALVRMSDVAAHAGVRCAYPAIAQALEASASPQLRNMASMGGNLLQRTRCPYFRADAALPCNKRRPGSGCAALDGDGRGQAIFGASERCIATQPSDLAVALAALDATVHIRSADAERTIALVDLHRLPGEEPHRDTVLEPGELIIAIEVPASGLAGRSRYLKLRERASYEFALVSVAVGLELDRHGGIRAARVALGGVAAKPWRLYGAEERLAGTELEADSLRAAIEPDFAGAHPRADNAFKVELAKRAVVRTLLEAGSQA